MSQPEISPLAKRLAEENNVDWHALQGSGPAGKVVERDVLEYLARVMAGEEDTNPTPEPTPDGMDSWPEEDVVNYQQETQPNTLNATANDAADDLLSANDLDLGDDLLADDIDLADDMDLLVDSDDDDAFLLDSDDSLDDGLLDNSSDFDDDSSFVEQLHNDVDASGNALYGRGSRGTVSAAQGIAAGGVSQDFLGDTSIGADDLLSSDDDAASDDIFSGDLGDADFSDNAEDALGDFGDASFDAEDSFGEDSLGGDDFGGSDFENSGFSDNDFGNDLESSADFDLEHDSTSATADLENNLVDDTNADIDFGNNAGFSDTDGVDGDFAIDSTDDIDSDFAIDNTDDVAFDSDDDLDAFGAGSELDANDVLAADATDIHDADLTALDTDSTNFDGAVGAVASTGHDSLHVDSGTSDDLSGDADLLAMDSNVDLTSDADDTTESLAFDTEAEHAHFAGTEVGEGTLPVDDSELQSDFDSFDTEQEHDHLGDSLTGQTLENDADNTFDSSTDDNFADGTDGDDVFASDDAVFSEANTLEENNAGHIASIAAAGATLAAGGAVAGIAAASHTTEQAQVDYSTQPQTDAYQTDSIVATNATTTPATHVSSAPVTTSAAPLAASSTGSLATTTGRSVTLRRYLDLELFNELQEQIVAALGEEATVAMIQKAALKALEEVPLTGQNINVFDVTHSKVKAVVGAGDLSLSGLVRAIHNADEGTSDMLVADLSRLNVDELSVDMGVPFLTLGRILWNGNEQQGQSSVAMLALSGNVDPEMGSRFLAVAAEMLENPLLLLL